MKLYFTPGTISLAVRIVLEDAGATFESELVDFRTHAQRAPEYLAINPKSRVPALVTDRGVLTETPAILAYIAQTHPEARLAPLEDPFALAEVQAAGANPTQARDRVALHERNLQALRKEIGNLI